MLEEFEIYILELDDIEEILLTAVSSDNYYVWINLMFIKFCEK